MNTIRIQLQKKGLFYYLIVIVYIFLVSLAFLVSTERKAILPLFPTIVRHFCDAGVIALSVLYFLVTAIKKRIPYFTTMAAARQAARGIKRVNKSGHGDVKSLQELHAMITEK